MRGIIGIWVVGSIPLAPKWGYHATWPRHQAERMPIPDTAQRKQLRYPGRCGNCATDIAAGTTAFHDAATKTVYCLMCDEVPVESGAAGASARREHDRRSDARENRIRTNHPKLGGFILALSEDPQSTKAWAVGAVGEEKLGKRLDALSSTSVRVLHDRRMPGSRANVDHIVVCPLGVYVIDAKRYKDQRPELRVEGGFFSPRTEKLIVGRRDRTLLTDGVLKQVDAVSSVLNVPGLDHVHVRGALCFIDGDWPLIGGSFTIRGLHVLWPAKISELIRRPGELDDATIERTFTALARALPSA